MISIIICSRRSEVTSSLRKNIECTIGVPYEIICIDNSERQYCICSAYNEGVKRARGKYLCFMHEDISFLSKDWGKIGISHFSDSEIGLVGVLGCTFFDECMPYWCVQSFCAGHNWCGRWHKVFSQELKTERVVAVDGLWMLMKKELFENGLIVWDDVTFHGFDMYDMDISMQVLKTGQKILIDPAICINHKSNGNYSKNFYESSMKFHEKWDYFLPVSTMDNISFCSRLSKQNAFRRICDLNIEYNRWIAYKMKWYNSEIRRSVLSFIYKLYRKI